MKTREKLTEFEIKFAKFKKNREQVPLELLRTKYAKAYGELVEWLEDYAEWYTREYIGIFALEENPKDPAGNEWLRKKLAEIESEERKPGRLYQKIRDSLIEDLDEEKFQANVRQLRNQFETWAYVPFVQHYNSFSGSPDKGRIYNSYINAYWQPDSHMPSGGFWRNENGDYITSDYPPQFTVYTTKQKG